MGACALSCFMLDKTNVKLQLSHYKGTNLILNQDEIISMVVLCEGYSEIGRLSRDLPTVYFPLSDRVMLEIKASSEAFFFNFKDGFVEVGDVDWTNMHEYLYKWVVYDPVLRNVVPVLLRRESWKGFSSSC